MTKRFELIAVMLFVSLVGCSDSKQVLSHKQEPARKVSIAYSEYISWSTFAAAETLGLINPNEGAQSLIEKKYNVDIVAKAADYDTCINLYGQGLVDSVCITNIDVLSPAQRVNTVVVAPTSTSEGGDALISTTSDLDAIPWDDLNNNGTIEPSERRVYGLERSVSEFVFESVLRKMNKNPKDYSFTNLDPAAAASALQTNQKGIRAIMVWNPFILQTLRTNEKTKVVFTSAEIPETVIDCIAFNKTFVDNASNDSAVLAVLETFYVVSDFLNHNDANVKSMAHKALGEKFCNLSAADIAVCCQQTRFFATPKQGMELFQSKSFKEKFPQVIQFARDKGIYESSETAPFQAESSGLVNFTTKYMDILSRKQ
jgi:ABC-type nitrate/sulfonate/bicarbonate transport system substrate-binding protein